MCRLTARVRRRRQRRRQRRPPTTKERESEVSKWSAKKKLDLLFVAHNRGEGGRKTRGKKGGKSPTIRKGRRKTFPTILECFPPPGELVRSSLSLSHHVSSIEKKVIFFFFLPCELCVQTGCQSKERRKEFGGCSSRPHFPSPFQSTQTPSSPSLPPFVNVRHHLWILRTESHTPRLAWKKKEEREGEGIQKPSSFPHTA